ncbi:hypothetical protein [Isoptericola sp. NPDC019482]|uniref:hypothetical protein n=1 Tax=Isoptericola sp. NPDC019482 TaxID=3154688 RepID=UPI0034916342
MTESADTSGDLPRLVKIAAEVLAPVTVITALLYFFGRKRAEYFFYYFGVDVTTLGLGTTDYLVVAQDGIVIPVVAVGLVVLVAAWLRSSGRLTIPGPRAAWSVLSAGAVLAGLGLLQVVDPGQWLLGGLPSWVPPIGFAGGVLLVAWAVRALRALRGAAPPSTATRMTEWGAVFLLISVAAFVAVSNYSAAVGANRARQFVDEMPWYPSVVLRSVADLGIVGDGVTARRCPVGEDGFRHRYDGLVLLVQAGDRYVFLPREVPVRPGAITVPINDQVRLDYQPAGGAEGSSRC